jgi:glycosyltransferase involved in cell wall biosynthesis
VPASDAPENSEVIGNAGFTFRKGDVDDLRRVLSLLLSDSRLRSAAGKAAQERVRERYLWSKVTGDVNHVYVQLINTWPMQNPSRTRQFKPGRLRVTTSARAER